MSSNERRPCPNWRVCLNCEQWQRPYRGRWDCFHECVARGFAPPIEGGSELSNCKLAFEKHGGDKEEPNWRAVFHGPWGDRLELATIERGTFATEVGPVPCWFVKGPLGGTQHRRLREAKVAVETALYRFAKATVLERPERPVRETSQGAGAAEAAVEGGE